MQMPDGDDAICSSSAAPDQMVIARRHLVAPVVPDHRCEITTNDIAAAGTIFWLC